MTETSGSLDISTKLERIAKQAKEIRNANLKTLAHHIDVMWLREAYRRTRKGGATGVDGQSATQYAEHLEENLLGLLDRAKSGRYCAPPVRRVHIPKGSGTETRPIGIPTFEDKVLQRAVTMVITEVYEQEFHDFSYGFRPGRSAHPALRAVQNAAWRMKGGWVVEVDIRKFFDTVDHLHLREILHRRIGDGVLLRLIGKWLNAGVIENLVFSRPDEGTPQGGVISPLLANIYLHEVFDEWFVRDVRPNLQAEAAPIRYADDLVVLFADKQDAMRFLAVLPKRLGKYGLTLHPDKTRMVTFRRPDRVVRDDDRPGTFDFLGFTHYWAMSPGKGVGREAANVQGSLPPRATPHLRVVSMAPTRPAGVAAPHADEQAERALRLFRQHWELRRIGSFVRRSLPWRQMQRIVQRFPLPAARIVHRYGT